ncbi:MAG: 23S rRNA (pseudouridine(1915)-N(3))-methyltransferase RlmH [Prevotellaceae bacterium]|jgi:23S rRNA (pseudouridine1915-N3)-methyltransferase|nr:23S rRNA (pseudouridine(1915)-N(3))-methyltransferase RlmH [Prevotellaceae bacterium]
MKIVLLMVGKTQTNYLMEGINEYLKRLKFYLPLEVEVIPDLKNTKSLSFTQQKEKSSELIINFLQDGDDVILLDERGREYSSLEFAGFMEKKLQLSARRLVFVIGGAYGFSEKLYARADGKLSVSRMTFSHQMIRLIFVEQLYRAMTIIKGEPYHHE